MKVRITLPQGYSNDKGVKVEYGKEAELYDDLALKLVRLNMAVPVVEPVIETAAEAAPQNAARRVGKPKSKAAS